MFSLSCFDISPLAGDGVRATNDGERFLLMISGEGNAEAEAGQGRGGGIRSLTAPARTSATSQLVRAFQSHLVLGASSFLFLQMEK